MYLAAKKGSVIPTPRKGLADLATLQQVARNRGRILNQKLFEKDGATNL